MTCMLECLRNQLEKKTDYSCVKDNRYMRFEDQLVTIDQKDVMHSYVCELLDRNCF